MLFERALSMKQRNYITEGRYVDSKELILVSHTPKSINVIRKYTNEKIERMNIEKIAIENGMISCKVKLNLKNDSVIPIELFRELNEKLTKEDKGYLELIVR